ncbi:MAG: ABC transporter ATP-binding protein [Spartobacteria bacterium]|nr:ABC transporter ATP-binding protein [Spartobacteria bacterium]
MSEYLVFDQIKKNYGSLAAVDNVSLEIKRGHIFSLLGPSGCGKTTLLRMLAGFEQPDSGRIFLDGKDITDIPPEKRKVNTIFQNYALFPHMTIRENIGFGLKMKKVGRKEIEKETDRMLELIQLESHADKRPHQLSGGQKQRAAIARALINKPNVLLLDEPLAALDLKLRQHMLLELDLIHDEVGITFVFVTHDQSESMVLSDQIAVMHDGHIEQIGTPAEIYESPRSSFVAAFIGDTNFLEGHVTRIIDVDYVAVHIDGLGDLVCFNDKNLVINCAVFLSIRPEKFTLSVEEPAADEKINRLHGRIVDIVYMGASTKYWVETGDYRIVINHTHRRYLLDFKPPTFEDMVWISWMADDSYMMERYQETDEELLFIPPEEIGEVEQSLADEAEGLTMEESDNALL